MSENQLSNNKTVKVHVLDETRFGLYQSKLKSIAAIMGFTEALELRFESKLPAKESDVLTSSARDKERQKK